jgi:hypothetical protein
MTHYCIQFFQRRITMSKKETSEPAKINEGEGSPRLALALLLVLVFAIVVLGLKAFGLF